MQNRVELRTESENCYAKCSVKLSVELNKCVMKRRKSHNIIFTIAQAAAAVADGHRAEVQARDGAKVAVVS